MGYSWEEPALKEEAGVLEELWGFRHRAIALPNQDRPSKSKEV